jgi:hypothetical protein
VLILEISLRPPKRCAPNVPVAKRSSAICEAQVKPPHLFPA